MSNSIKKKAADLRRGDVAVNREGVPVLIVLEVGSSSRRGYVCLTVWNVQARRSGEEMLPDDWSVLVEVPDPAPRGLTPEGAVVQLAARARAVGAL